MGLLMRVENRVVRFRPENKLFFASECARALVHTRAFARREQLFSKCARDGASFLVMRACAVMKPCDVRAQRVCVARDEAMESHDRER